MYKNNFQSVIVNNKLIAGGKQGENWQQFPMESRLNADGGHKFE